MANHPNRSRVLGRRALDNLEKLPALCAARLPTDGSSILIERGEPGYLPRPGLDVDAYNQRHGINAAQVEAMLAGSMFGWHVPAADPNTWMTLGVIG